MSGDYDPKGIYSGIYRAKFDLRGSGYPKLSLSFNLWLYKMFTRVLVSTLARHGVEVRGRKVLEFACGTGYFTDFFDRRGPGGFTGIDITPESVAALASRYPAYAFMEADVTDPGLDPPGGPFDLATSLNVLYHVLDDEKFTRAIANMARSLLPGGFALFNDNFPRESTEARGHVRFRSIELYQRAMDDAGLELVEFAPVHFWGVEPVGDPDDPVVQKAQLTWGRISKQARKSELRGYLAGLATYLMNRPRRVDDPHAAPFGKLILARKKATESE